MCSKRPFWINLRRTCHTLSASLCLLRTLRSVTFRSLTSLPVYFEQHTQYFFPIATCSNSWHWHCVVRFQVPQGINIRLRAKGNNRKIPEMGTVYGCCFFIVKGHGTKVRRRPSELLLFIFSFLSSSSSFITIISSSSSTLIIVVVVRLHDDDDDELMLNVLRCHLTC